MKVAYFAESQADQAALTIFTETILGSKTVPVIHAGLRHRGWPAVKTALRAVYLQLHYHTDAEGFVFIVDSNGSPPHQPEHDLPGGADPMCRLCQLRRILDDARKQVRERPNQPPLKVAVGVAVPAIEAWLLCGVNSQVSETAWINGIKENRSPYAKTSLKTELYGTSHPSLDVETEVMKAAATRLSANLNKLESSFPSGFGALRSDLKKW